jgi:hypothetical protein
VAVDADLRAAIERAAQAEHRTIAAVSVGWVSYQHVRALRGNGPTHPLFVAMTPFRALGRLRIPAMREAKRVSGATDLGDALVQTVCARRTNVAQASSSAATSTTGKTNTLTAAQPKLERSAPEDSEPTAMSPKIKKSLKA